MVKAISILGSTGSIGRQTAQAAGRLGIPVLALAARRDVDRLEEQARQFRPKYISVMDSAAAKELRARLSDTDIEIGEGEESLIAAATVEGADCVVTGISGSVGLRPTLAAIHQKRRIALANKETLVCAGEIVMAEAARCGAEILPVDSEHSAIFQSMAGRDKSELRRILLTGSGGPFRLDTRADARRHARARRASSELEHGREDQHRQRHDDEQRSGIYRGHASFRRDARSDQSHHPPGERHSLHGGAARRHGHRAARRGGYGSSHPVRAHVSRAARVGGEADGFRRARLHAF